MNTPHRIRKKSSQENIKMEDIPISPENLPSSSRHTPIQSIPRKRRASPVTPSTEGSSPKKTTTGSRKIPLAPISNPDRNYNERSIADHYSSETSSKMSVSTASLAQVSDGGSTYVDEGQEDSEESANEVASRSKAKSPIQKVMRKLDKAAKSPSQKVKSKAKVISSESYIDDLESSSESLEIPKNTRSTTRSSSNAPQPHIESDSDDGPLTITQQRERPKAYRGEAQFGLMGPTPTGIDNFTDGDKLIVRMRLNGKNWKEIEKAWDEWAGAKAGNSTVRKRWKKLEVLMLKDVDSDVDIHYLGQAIKQWQKEKDDWNAKHSAKKWAKVANAMAVMGEKRYLADVVFLKYQNLNSSHQMSAGGDWEGDRPLDLSSLKGRRGKTRFGSSLLSHSTGGSDDSDDIESSSEEEEDTGNARELESENEQRRSPSVDVASDDASRPRRRRTVRNGKIVELDDNDEIMEDI